MKVEITPRKKWRLFNPKDIEEISHYRDLLYMLVMRDISTLYKQTILGFAWAIFKPLLQVLVFTLVFGYLMGMRNTMGGLPYSLFSLTGLVPWVYFSTALLASTGSLVANTQFLTKVYFPRVIIPLVPIISKLIDFAVSFLVLLAVVLFYYFVPGPYHPVINSNIVFLPLITLLMMLATFGCGLWLSAMAIQYRDVQQLIQFMIQILMYSAPVIWPLSYLNNHTTVKFILSFYPMVGIIQGFRVCLLGGEMPWQLLGIGTLSTVVLLITGLIYFRTKEDLFADVA